MTSSRYLVVVFLVVFSVVLVDVFLRNFQLNDVSRHFVKIRGNFPANTSSSLSRAEMDLQVETERRDGVTCYKPLTELHDVLIAYRKLPLQPHEFLRKYKSPCWYECKGRKADGGVKLRCLPYFYIIGAAKSGTGDLYTRLSHHHQVLDKHKRENRWMHKTWSPMSKYLYVFQEDASSIQASGDNASNFIFGDGSPVVMWRTDWPRDKNCMTSACLLHSLNPRARIIVILREPVARMYSQYHWQKWKYYKEPDPLKFHKYVDRTMKSYQRCLQHNSTFDCIYNDHWFSWDVRIDEHGPWPLQLQVGLYATYLKEWLRVFPREQMFIIRTEDFERDVNGTMQSVFRFLDVDLNLTTGEKDRVFTSKQVHKRQYPPMLEKSRKLLGRFYENSNKELAALLNDSRFTWRDVAEEYENIKS